MAVIAKNTKVTIIPTMRYNDASAAIKWLCNAFGFEKHAVHEDGNGGIVHAQLTLGNGMIMLGSARADEFGALQTTPRQLGGTTQSAYIIVNDPDALYARAKQAGAEIVMELADQDYGSRDFSCRDREGHLWNFGTYDPWTASKSES